MDRLAPTWTHGGWWAAARASRLRFLLPRAATLAVCCLLAAPTAALADTGLGAASSFLWQRPGDGATLSGPQAVTTVPGSADAIVAGQVLHEVADPTNPGHT